MTPIEPPNSGPRARLIMKKHCEADDDVGEYEHGGRNENACLTDDVAHPEEENDAENRQNAGDEYAKEVPESRSETLSDDIVCGSRSYVHCTMARMPGHLTQNQNDVKDH
eukprot:m.894 g.894  ORF g.894 m.894 type:complete len:110 (+) comp5084_c0_seq1:83-412(+)